MKLRTSHVQRLNHEMFAGISPDSGDTSNPFRYLTFDDSAYERYHQGCYWPCGRDPLARLRTEVLGMQIHSEEAPDIHEQARVRAVAFSDKVALIPAIGDFFDRPLWTNCRSSGLVQLKRGQWVNEGERLACFDIRTSAHRGFWLSLLIEMFSNPTTVCIYSPVAGLVLDLGGVFLGQQWVDSTTGLYGRGYMMAVLLPEHASVPETCKLAFTEFCDFCLDNRQAIFHNQNLIAETGRPKVMEIWSESNILQTVNTLRAAPVIVRPADAQAPNHERPYSMYVDQFTEYARKLR